MSASPVSTDKGQWPQVQVRVEEGEKLGSADASSTMLTDIPFVSFLLPLEGGAEKTTNK